MAFATLVGIVTAHAMLETARDALFLEALPARHLPLAYLAIAAFALILGELNQRLAARVPRRKLLAATLVCGGLITAGFWRWTAARHPWVLGALYVWSGLLATVVVVQFWLLLGDVLDVSRAKRLFPLIGAGGLVGATLGSAGAGVLLALFDGDGRLLIAVAGGLFVVAAVVPLGFAAPRVVEAPRRRRGRPPAAQGVLRLLVSDRYLLRLFIMVLVSAVLLTGIDFLFKSTVASAAQQSGWALGPFFARFYAAVAVVALLVQLVVAPRLLRAVGVDRVLLLLPLLVLLGSVGFVLTLGLIPALLLKGTDGALRHSVHRTASEILYLPLSRQVRERFKSFAAAVGQRGGQALASLLLLAFAAVASEPRALGAAIIGFGLLWLISLVGLQPHYLELFRRQLRDGTLETDVDVPALDLASFEALVAALSSADDAEVIAALELFTAYGKTDLVPALILYHPSREVVLRAFKLFARTQRTDVTRLTKRLLQHDDPEIRAAALRATSGARPDERQLREHLSDGSAAVRCTALVALISAELLDDDEATASLGRMVDSDDADTRLALARALRRLPPSRFAWVGTKLSRGASPELASELAASMAAAPHERYLPALLQMLAQRGCRAEARRALLAAGEAALRHLEQALGDTSAPRAVRRHLPRTISRFPADRAAPVLLDALERERDEAVLLKILRGLGRMRVADPSLPVDRERLLAQARRQLEGAVDALHWRLAVAAIVEQRPRRSTPAAQLLLALLDERQQQALQRLFRLLHIIEPTEHFRIIYDGLRSGDPKTRGSSLELLSHVVPRPLRDGILALVDDQPPERRLAAVASLYEPAGRASWLAAIAAAAGEDDAAVGEHRLDELYVEVLRSMLRVPHDALRSLVGYHAAELDLGQLRDEVAAIAQETTEALGEVAGQALGLFDERGTEEANHER